MAGRYPVKAVANWFIDRFAKDGRAPTQLQLQKLTYIAHGWHLGIDPNGDGFVAEPVYAWKYGPVFTPLRDEFSRFGANYISEHATDMVSGTETVEPNMDDQDPEAWELGLLDWVYDRYRERTGPSLIELTHRPGTPWDQVTNGGRDVGWNRRIPNELIRKHYAEILKKEHLAG